MINTGPLAHVVQVYTVGVLRPATLHRNICLKYKAKLINKITGKILQLNYIL